MVDVGDLFGKGSIGEQFVLWNVLSSLSAPVLAPVIQSIANRVWDADPSVPLSPETAAELVARGFIVQSQGEDQAVRSGVSSENFAKLVQASRHAPPFEALVAGVRRGLIGGFGAGDAAGSLTDGLNDLGIDPKWWDLLNALVVNKPTGEAALQALLEGQIDEDLAKQLWVQAGEDPDWFQHAFDSQGAAPTPDMAGTMANRGIIPWDGQGPGVTSFQQAFLEGPWRNKWEPAMKALQEYLPPPRTVTAMMHNGSLTDAQALALFRKEGLSVELAAAYVADAHHAKAAATKDLTQAQISALYRDGKITEARAEQLLVALGYSQANAALVLSLANVQKADTHVTAAIGRVRTLYVAHKITAKAAKDSLISLKVAADQATELMDLWDIEIGINVRQLTPAQIMAAWSAQVISQAEAQTELEHLGYTEFDAWVLMSTHNGGPLPGKPASGVGVGVNP